MRIAIDLLPITGANAGLQVYAKQLVEGLAAVDHRGEYTLLVNAHAQGLFDVGAPNFRTLAVRTPRRFISLWEQHSLAVRRLLRHVDLLHSPVSAPPPQTRCRRILTIHDLTFRLYPETMQWWNRLLWNHIVTRGARCSDAVITDSESTRRDVVDLLHVDAERVAVVHLAASALFQRRITPDEVDARLARLKVERPYVLYVGTLEPRKNIPTLIRAFSIFKRYLNSRHTLVAVGKKGWLFTDIFRTVKQLGLEDDVVFTGFVPDSDLPALYQGAEFFVYPSLYEGFGLPPLEAMVSGTPVIASNCSSIPEVVGHAGLLVNPEDADAIAGAMITLALDPDMRARLAEAGRERARIFTPVQMARRTRDVYVRVVGKECSG